MMSPSINLDVINQMTCNTGDFLGDLTEKQPILLVFLRHFGCVFCKEALSELSDARETIEGKGVQIVFVHMSPLDVAEKYFQNYDLPGAIHISNPTKSYYAAFGLMKGTISQLYGLRTWIRGFGARKEGHKLELAEELGDSTQMPGIYLLYQRQLKESYIHRHASSRPDYEKLIAHVLPL